MNVSSKEPGAGGRITRRWNKRWRQPSKQKPRDEWLKILEAHDVPAVPLYNVAEVLDDPQVKHLGLIEELEHPQAGQLKFVGGPVGYDNLSKTKSAPPPLVGEHSEKFSASWVTRSSKSRPCIRRASSKRFLSRRSTSK